MILLTKYNLLLIETFIKLFSLFFYYYVNYKTCYLNIHCLILPRYAEQVQVSGLIDQGPVYLQISVDIHLYQLSSLILDGVVCHHTHYRRSGRVRHNILPRAR